MKLKVVIKPLCYSEIWGGRVTLCEINPLNMTGNYNLQDIFGKIFEILLLQLKLLIQ